MIFSDYYRTPFLRLLKRFTPSAFKTFVIFLINNKIVIDWIKTRNKTLRGTRYNFSIVPDDVVIYIYMGIWESAEIYMAKKYLKSKKLIIECGSSLGVLASSFLSNNDCENYVAIEANPESYNILTQQLSAYKARCINLAVAYPEQKIAFNPSSILGGRVFVDKDSEKPENIFYIQGMPLSQIIYDVMPNFQGSFSLILDIEGMESLIFKHDSEFVKNARFIICELENTSDYSIDDQIDMLIKMNFVIVERYDNVFAFGNQGVLYE